MKRIDLRQGQATLPNLLQEIADRAHDSDTRPHGLKVLDVGEGLGIPTVTGLQILGPEWAESLDRGIAAASDEVSEAAERLETAEVELEAARGRIDETTELLSGLDERSEATAAEVKAASERVAQAEADLEAAREELRAADAAASVQLAALDGRLDQNASELTSLSSTMEAVSQQSSEAKTAADAATADLAATKTVLGEARGDITALSTTLKTTRTDLTTLGNELSATATTATEARDQADAVGRGLAATDARLTATGKDLADLVPRVGSVESAVSASDARMTELSSTATAANQAAQDAMSAAQAAEARVQALANAQGSLILNGGFEQPVDETAEWRYATTAAHGGSYVGRFLLSSGNRDITWPQARAARGQSLELRYWARGLGGYSNTAMQAYIVVEKKDGTVQSVYSTSDSIIPKLSQNWQEFVFRFAPLPEGTRSVTPRTGVRPSGGDNGYVFMDDVTLHDIASYQEALDAALAARAEAERASQEALDAMERANAAYDSASGKNSIRNATTAPQGVGTATGDVWRQWSAYPGGTVTAEWAWDGTAWRPQQLSHQMLSSLDLGKATVGQLHGSYITAGSIGADRMTIGVGVNALADPYFTDADLRARRSSASTGAWTYSVSGSRPCMELTTPVTGFQTFRYAPLGTTGLIPTVAGRKWRIEVPMYLSGGQARINVRWYDALGSAFSYAAAGAYASGPGDVTIVGEVESPSQAVGFLVDVYMPASSVARTAKVYGGASVVSKTGTVHIEDGAVKARQVDAQSVAGAVGQFVKVQANNVEVTEALSARVVEALSATSKRLVVTEDAILNRATVIQELVAPVVKATKVSTDQLIAGTASLDTATANKLFADIFAANRITAAQINVTEALSAEVARLMDIKAKNLIVTGNANLSGETFIKTLATAEIAAAKIGVGQLTAGSASLDTATANRLFADIFAANKITGRELFIGSGTNLIPGGWGGTSKAAPWAAFGLNTNESNNAGQPAGYSYWVQGRSTVTATVTFGVETGREYRFSVWVKSDVDGSRFYMQVLTNNGAADAYLLSNETAPNGSWKEYRSTWIPGSGVTEVRGIQVYANHPNGTVTSGQYQWFGAFTLTPAVDGVLIKDGSIAAPKIDVTGDLSAKVFTAVSATTAESFVRDRLVVGGAFEVLGESIVNDLNVRGKLRGRDAILAGTLDVKQLNVTEDMAAQIVSAMTVNTKKLVVTEAAVMQHVTAIEGIITPKITASEARIGDLLAGKASIAELQTTIGHFNTLIAQKASIADIQGGNLTLTGFFRSGAAGKPGVIIPQNYTTERGFQQLGIWLSPTGVAPSLGSEWGSTAGIWLDEAANVAGTGARSPLHIRGQSGEGIHIYGKTVIHKVANMNSSILESSVGEPMQVQAADGQNLFMWARGGGVAQMLSTGSGAVIVRNSGTGSARVESSSGEAIVWSDTGNVFLWSGGGDAAICGKKSTRIRTDANIQLENMDGTAYNRVWTGGGLLSLYMGQSSGTVYRQASSARYKTDIVTMEPDHEWLDLRTVWYRDKAAVECAEAVAARQAAGDTTPITAQEYEMIDAAKRLSPGRIAEEAHTGGAAAQVAYGPDGTPEGYNYERDGTMLIPHVREHRDQLRDQDGRIAALEARLEALEGAA